MLFFCPLDNPHAPIPTTTAEQKQAIAWDGTRARPGLAAEANTPERAAALALAYLRDCHASGWPNYAPTVSISDREGVPTLHHDGPLPDLTEREQREITGTIAHYAARHNKGAPLPAPTDAPLAIPDSAPITDSDQGASDL